MIKYFDINEAGHSIRCKLYCNDIRNIKKAVLFGHGFGGHKDNKAAQRFADSVTSKYKSAAVITFDWPCHGDDGKKKLVLADCGEYITLVAKYARERLGAEDLYAHATSFGGYLMLKYISENGNPFRKIVLRCPAVNMYQSITRNIIAPDAMEKLEKGKEALVGFDRKIKISPQFLEDLKTNDITQRDFLDYAEDILILHGTKDEVIPCSASIAFCDQNLIEFQPIEKADHRFMDPNLMNLAIKYTLEFFSM